MPATYERQNTDEIVVSQYILISKLGFVDGYKKDMYDVEKLLSIMHLCDGPAESYLDLKHGDMTKYEEYKNTLFDINKIATLFAKRSFSPQQQRRKE